MSLFELGSNLLGIHDIQSCNGADLLDGFPETHPLEARITCRIHAAEIRESNAE